MRSAASSTLRSASVELCSVVISVDTHSGAVVMPSWKATLMTLVRLSGLRLPPSCSSSSLVSPLWQ